MSATLFKTLVYLINIIQCINNNNTMILCKKKKQMIHISIYIEIESDIFTKKKKQQFAFFKKK